MPRGLPKLSRHKSGQGYARFGGQSVYFGVWPEGQKTPPPEVRQAYDQHLADWLKRKSSPTPLSFARSGTVSVSELVVHFVAHARAYYRAETGEETSEVPLMVRVCDLVQAAFPLLRTSDFTPQHLAQVRQRMIDLGWTRNSINKQVSRVRTVFKWGVSKGLVPVAIADALRTLAPLRKNRTAAPEARKKKPAAWEQIQAVARELSPTLRDLVTVHYLLGCRAEEITGATPREIVTTGPMWSFQPAHSKTDHHESAEQLVHWIGPKARAILERRMVGLAPEKIQGDDEPMSDIDQIKRPVDPTNPAHYRQGGIECIDAIHAALGREQFLGFLRGSAMKYQWRFLAKDGERDLSKAEWFIRRLIEEMKKPAPAPQSGSTADLEERLRIAQGQVGIWQERAQLLDERCKFLERARHPVMTGSTLEAYPKDAGSENASPEDEPLDPLTETVWSDCNADPMAPSPTIRKCSQCNGAGRVDRIVPSFDGRGTGYIANEPCPTCATAGDGSAPPPPELPPAPPQPRNYTIAEPNDPTSPPPACPQCEGKKWVRNLVFSSEGVAVGTVNKPCPDCVTPGPRIPMPPKRNDERERKTGTPR